MLTNEARFAYLRGYYEEGLYHPNGGSGIAFDAVMRNLGFESPQLLVKWYQDLDNVGELQKDWCRGNCCQSLLRNLLQEAKSMKYQKKRT